MGVNSITVTVRISLDLAERIKAATDNRNGFIVEAIEEKLNPIKPEPLTEKEQREVLKGAKNLNDLMQDLILQEAVERKNFLRTMDNEAFAKLVAARLPKELQNEGELDADVLSLQECLSMLPSVPDLTAELNKVKGLLYKAERERDINLKLLEHGKNKAQLAELMDMLYRKVVEYAVDLVARRNLPGFGDGGGISDRSAAEIAETVRKELDQLKIYRSRI